MPDLQRAICHVELRAGFHFNCLNLLNAMLDVRGNVFFLMTSWRHPGIQHEDFNQGVVQYSIVRLPDFNVLFLKPVQFVEKDPAKYELYMYTR